MTRKREYVFASFNNDRRLSLGDKQIIAWAEKGNMSLPASIMTGD